MMQELSRFTDRARKVMWLAGREAKRLGAPLIESEHVLLGLVAEGAGVAANVIRNLDVDLAQTREAVDEILGRSGSSAATKAESAQMPAAKCSIPPRESPPSPELPLGESSERIVVAALDEARTIGHNYVGTEHLLLGLVAVDAGKSHEALAKLGLKPSELRKETLSLLGHGEQELGKEF